jgi:hypothetical protein
MKYLEAEVTLYMRNFLAGYSKPEHDISSPLNNSNGINWTLYDLCSWQNFVKEAKKQHAKDIRESHSLTPNVSPRQQKTYLT